MATTTSRSDYGAAAEAAALDDTVARAAVEGENREALAVADEV